MLAHGFPRTTLDVDIFIRRTRDNVERLIGALSEVGFGIAKELSPDEVLARKVLLFADQVRVDIFTQPWGLTDFDSCWNRRVEVDVEGTRVAFLGREDLICSKETDRPQDRQDVEALRPIGRAPDSTAT